MRYNQRKKFADCGHVGSILIAEKAFWYECTCGYLGDMLPSRKEAEYQGAEHALKAWPEIAKYFDDNRVGAR